MLVDAIILTGGRSSRLDSVPKSEFVVEGSTLLDRTLNAAGVARRIVVVGHVPSSALPEGVVLVREEPPFSGPVAAISAGIAALRATAEAVSGDDLGVASDALLILACDMPHIGLAVPSLLRALGEAKGAAGVIAVDAKNRRQPLAAIYRTEAIVAALDAAASTARHGDQLERDPLNHDPLAGLPMFRLLDHMNLVNVEVVHDATADVDTWDDAVRLEATPPANLNKGNQHG